MKQVFTKEEFAVANGVLGDLFDRVELVDPITCQCIDPETLQPTECCHRRPGSERCESCLGIRAYNSQGRTTCLQVENEIIYNYVTRYIEVDGKPMLQVLSNAVNNMLDENDIPGKESIIRGIEQQTYSRYHDYLTGAFNRRYMEDSYAYKLPVLARSAPVYLAIVRINESREIFTTYGRDAHDRMLCQIASMFQQQINMEHPDGIVARYSGSTFIVSSVGHSREYFENALERMYADARKVCRISLSRTVPYTLTMVLADWQEAGDWSCALKLLDQRLNQACTAHIEGVVRG